MKYCTLIGLTLLLTVCAGNLLAAPDGFRTLNIGDAAPDFKLPGVDGKSYSLANFGESQLLMVVFTCNHCPTAQAYEERIKAIHKEYDPQGVAVVAISPNDPQAVRLDELGYTDLGDSLAEMKVRATQAGFRFPYLYDGETQETSLSYGVLATPHVFIFDRQRKLRYKGRIDDSEVRTVKSHDARNALDALLAGKPVPVPKTRVFGCSTKWSEKRGNAQASLKKWDQEPVKLSLLSPAQLKELSANKTKNYRLINVWATFCVPCIGELPEFVTMNRMYRGRNFEMITISADDVTRKDDVWQVLRKARVACQNFVFASDSRDELFDNLDEKSEGGIPYTVLIAPGGKVIHRIHGEIDPAKLKRMIADNLGRTYASRVRQPGD